MKALIFMCGEGLGHTTRCLSVGKRFVASGSEVVFAGYGYSKKMAEDSGYRVLETPPEATLVGKGGSLDVKESIEESIKNLDPLMYSKVVSLLKEEQPDIVISDSYSVGAFAAKRQDLPVILILNQTDVGSFFTERRADVSLIGNVVTRFSEMVHKQVDRMIIPDYPPPYTICSRNAQLTADISDKIVYSGPLVRKKVSEVIEAKIKNPHVLCSIGGFGYRQKLLQNIILAAMETPDLSYTLVTGPNVDLASLGSIPDNVSCLGYLNDPFPYLKASDVIIAAGGHSTIMECLSFGKPVMSFPDMFHSEQENNAQRLDELGLGKRMSYYTPPFMLAGCLEETMQCSGKARRMMEYAEKLDGPGRVLKEAETLIEDANKKI